MTRKRREALIALSFLSIWLIGFVIFTAIPLIRSFIFSFNEVKFNPAIGIEKNFMGFKNYINVFTTPAGVNYTVAIVDFLGEIILNVPIIIVFSIIMAVMLNQKIKFKGFFRSIYFLPVIITSGPIINSLLNQGAAEVPLIQQLGILTFVQSNFTPFIANALTKLFTELIVILWFSGVQILLIIAALQKIDKQIYEAAMIDGAGSWESFWKITLPSLKNIIFVSVIYTIVNLATFANNPVINEISKNMFNQSTGFGFASAQSWIYFIIVFLLLGLSMLIFKPRDKEKRGVN